MVKLKYKGVNLLELQVLLQDVSKYHAGSDLGLIEKAYKFASQVHAGQVRLSGENYFSHCLVVGKILSELRLDLVTISAGILHDVMEDGGVTRELLRENFGEEIAFLVEGVTKISSLSFKSAEEHEAENWRKMLLAMTKDIRCILIKLADRLHNMRTLEYLPEEKRGRIARETLDIFAPLSHRLGIGRIKWELEDLAFRHLQPEAYYELVEKVSKKRKERESYIDEVKEILNGKLQEAGIKTEIGGRPKHLYSIYQKMGIQGKEFNEIYDLTALRVVTENVRDCYAALGIIHSLWTPMPGRFKDFIARPKSNMYQSLHTTVMAPGGEPLEIQIRTWEMHHTAEEGIAAHWRYKEGGRGETEFDKKLIWLRELLEWLQELKDPQELMEDLKVNLFAQEIYVFTPKGDVKELPAEATPVDFAYSIHSELGNHCVGAKVNGKMVPLKYTLQSGDIIEINTSPVHSPSRDWLKYVKTARAKNRIRHWFRLQEHQPSVVLGKDDLEKELVKHNLNPVYYLKSPELLEISLQFGFKNIEELLANIGFGKISVRQIVNRFLPQEKQVPEESLPIKKKVSQLGINVAGMDDLLVRLAKCCHPMRGDSIVGFITRGRGVSIHRRKCPNIYRADGERQIEAGWSDDDSHSYEVTIVAEAFDRTNLMRDILDAIAAAKAPIQSASARATTNGMAMGYFVLEIKDLTHLKAIVSQVEKVKGVVTVYRAEPGKRTSA